MPKAYVLFKYNLADPEKMGTYIPGAVGTIIENGGQVLIASEDSDRREGSSVTGRTAIIEFPNRAAAEGWYASSAYQALAPIRREATTDGYVVILDGFVPPSP